MGLHSDAPVFADSDDTYDWKKRKYQQGMPVLWPKLGGHIERIRFLMEIVDYYHANNIKGDEYFWAVEQVETHDFTYIEALLEELDKYEALIEQLKD